MWMAQILHPPPVKISGGWERYHGSINEASPTTENLQNSFDGHPLHGCWEPWQKVQRLLKPSDIPVWQPNHSLPKSKLGQQLLFVAAPCWRMERPSPAVLVSPPVLGRYGRKVNCQGHAKLRGRVLRVRRVLRRRGCMNTVLCQRWCYVMKQHCLWCVWAGENEYINNCQTLVMQRCKRVHFQAYPC